MQHLQDARARVSGGGGEMIVWVCVAEELEFLLVGQEPDRTVWMTQFEKVDYNLGFTAQACLHLCTVLCCS